MLTFTLFASLDANSFAGSFTASWSEWFEKLSTPCGKTKNTGLPLVGFYSLKNEKAPRCDDNIDKIYALALDYEETYGTVPTLDEFEISFEHLIYTTPSHTQELPRYRVVVPLAEPISPDKVPHAFSELLEWVPVSGLDPSCADVSRSFFVHTSKTPQPFTHPSKLGNGLYFEPLLVDTELYDKWQKTPRPKPTLNGQYSTGRNDTLKAQACAAIGIGKSIDEVALELTEYDRAYHNPPLFNDSSEPNFRDGPTPLKRAESFIRRVTKKIQVPEIKVSHGEAIVGQNPDKVETIIPIHDNPTSGTMPESLFNEANSLLKEVAQFIYENSYCQNMAYSLACAVSALSMLKRTRFRNGDMYPNLHIALVGETSSGKSSSARTAYHLINKLGVADYCIGSPFSPSGLGRALERHQGEGYWFWEEFGNSLESTTSRNAQSHEKSMLGELNKIYDKAGDRYLMNSYANEKNKPIVLERAFLSILATGTTDEVQKLITGGSVASGFFPRWLLVSPESPSTHQLQSKRPDRLPMSLTTKINRLEALFPNWMEFNAQVDIGFTNEAAQVALGFRLGPQEHPALWGKFMQNATKIALAICEGKEITLQDLTFGMLFAKYSTEFIEKLYNYQTALTQSIPLLRRDSQSIFDRLLAIFKKNPSEWLEISQLCKALVTSEKTVRNYLHILIASEKISVGNEATGEVGNPKKVYRLKKE